MADCTEIPGDPAALHGAADALEDAARGARDIPESIRAARTMALAGWSAPSAEGFRAFSERAEACGGALIGAVLAIGGHVHTYADELKAIQEAFAAAKHDADRAGERADSAERGSHAERAADEDLDDAKRVMGSARMAALEASRRAAERIRAVIEGLPAVPAPPAPPPAPAQDRPWYEDFAAWEYEQGLGFLKGFGEGVVGIGEGIAMLYRLSLTNALLDTDSFLEQWSDLGRAAEYAWDNPLEFGKAVVNWEDLSAGRYGEWLGNLGPDALLAIGTAGAGTAASRGLRGAKALEDVAEVAPGAKRLEGARPATVPAPPQATLGRTSNHDYRRTFFEAFPQVRARVVVHHAANSRSNGSIQTSSTPTSCTRWRTSAGFRSSATGRYIFSDIRKDWNRFYKANPDPTREELMQHATEIDRKFGSSFDPPR